MVCILTVEGSPPSVQSLGCGSFRGGKGPPLNSERREIKEKKKKKTILNRADEGKVVFHLGFRSGPSPFVGNLAAIGQGFYKCVCRITFQQLDPVNLAPFKW